MSGPDAIALTRSLLRFDTVNPPGRERDCARYAGGLLEEWGYRVDYHEYADSRTSVIARAGGSDAKAPLCLTGHLDVVPVGARAWTHDPFNGETAGDRLYGRGASDMKAGVAAILLAARAMAKRLAGTPGVVIVLTAAEEGGCIGSKNLVETALLGRAGAMIVGEPTSNYPLVGHKGSVKFHARFKGVSAHGSMPHLGVNAIYKAARALGKLEAFDFGVPAHAVMGKPTLNVGTIHGGLNTNSVPDRATITVDTRTVPGIDHVHLCESLQALVAPRGARVRRIVDTPALYTEPANEWIQQVFETCAPLLGARPTPKTITFSTDGADLKRGFGGPPAVILGPGEPKLAHQTDEWCSMTRIDESVELFRTLMRRWNGA